MTTGKEIPSRAFQGNIMAAINLLVFIMVIVVNALANILPINGLNTGEVSALYPTLFTPAGFTFGIWSIIYLALFIFSIYQFTLTSQPYFQNLSRWFVISCLANAGWIVVWHHLQPFLSLLIMVLLLVSLVRIFLVVKQTPSMRHALLVQFPFALYLAWICVATIANVTIVFTSLGWHGQPFSPEIWTVIMTILATGLAVFIALKFYHLAFLLVTAWALFGIYSRHEPTSVISKAIQIEMIVLIGSIVFLLWRFIRNQIQKSGSIN